MKKKKTNEKICKKVIMLQRTIQMLNVSKVVSIGSTAFRSVKCLIASYRTMSTLKTLNKCTFLNYSFVLNEKEKNKRS